MIRFKNVVMVIFLSIGGWIGWKTYSYFFDKEAPIVVLNGIAPDAYCAGDSQCSVSASKTGQLSIWIDGNPLVQDFYLKAQDKHHPFTIPTRTLSNAKHELRVALKDNSYNKNTTEVTCGFYVDNTPLQAAFVKETGFKVLQGRTLHVQFQVNKEIKNARVHALAETYACFSESKKSTIYECYIPITCEEKPNEYLFSVHIKDCVGNDLTLDNKFQIVAYPFKKGSVTIDPLKMEEEKQRGRAIAELEESLAQLAKQSPKEKLWRGTFCTPIEIQQVTCAFGTIRTTQERGRYMHKALDIINTPKSVVWAPQEGVVVMKDRFDFSGNTVVIDHGYGLLSLFFHLDDFADIEIGQKIAQGNPLGTLGKTGYATGYHLHWEMRMNNTAIDPMQWTKETF